MVALDTQTGRSPRRIDTQPQWQARADQAVQIWLFTVAVLVFCMIVVGGATRLTDSGLSITEWKPLLGAIPPLTDADWQAALQMYRQIPEYQEINKGMSMSDFQFIYWWEWGHRFLGRFIGLAFALPLAFFWMTGRLRSDMKLKLLAVLALGGLQGAVGWYMVQSGLVERVDVSQYRLALHLTIAFVILSIVMWLALSHGPRREAAPARAPSAVWWGAVAVFGLVLAQVVLGAFVAGTKAGLVYNTWPDMNGTLIPDGLALLQPWYLNAFENHTAIQFNHRLSAYVLLAAALFHVVQVWRMSGAQNAWLRGATLLLAALVVQAGFGVWTLLAADGAIPIGLGLIHQGGAAVITALSIWHLYRLTYPTEPNS